MNTTAAINANAIRPAPWRRLATAARRIADDRSHEIPAGFATRVVAIAFARVEPTLSALFARLAWRAFGVASVLMIASVALNLGSAVEAIGGDDARLSAAVHDPVGEYLEAAQP
ncbi:MAG: hypothetical protein LBR12_04720 [Opitutaceae bacterium]|jgi:hypothetical protein|nr:hypothetical protein [Opitutaceae bacterium]